MLAGWKEVCLGDVADIYSGFAFKSKEMSNSQSLGVPLVKIKNINYRKVSKEFDSYLKSEFILQKHSKYRLLSGDILVAMTGQGSVGRIGKMHEVDSVFYVNQRVGIVRVNEFKADKEFIFQQMADSHNERVYFNLAMGAGQPNLSPNDIGCLKIKLPPLETQKKIAKILSNYDDLIENNLKRIKLLEEKAQQTYEEWFVRMKFPNHENTPVDKTTGLPLGWEKVKFSSIVNVNPRTSIKKGKIAPYVPMTSISESSMIITPVEERAVSGGTKFKNGDTLFARITPCLQNGKTGFVHFMDDNDEIATGSTEYIVLRETNDCGRYFIYCTSRCEEFRGNAINSMVGSDGRQRVKPVCFDKYLVNYAPLELRVCFEKLSKPLFESIKILVDKNKILKEARDILLPRLMTGIIDVAKI